MDESKVFDRLKENCIHDEICILTSASYLLLVQNVFFEMTDLSEEKEKFLLVIIEFYDLINKFDNSGKTICQII